MSWFGCGGRWEGDRMEKGWSCFVGSYLVFIVIFGGSGYFFVFYKLLYYLEIDFNLGICGRFS